MFQAKPGPTTASYLPHTNLSLFSYWFIIVKTIASHLLRFLRRGRLGLLALLLRDLHAFYREDEVHYVGLVRRHARDHLQGAQVQGAWGLAQYLGGLPELLGSLALALGDDYRRALLPLGLGLPGNRLLHGVGQDYVLYLYPGYVEPPLMGVLLDSLRYRFSDRFPVGEQLVERPAADHVPYRGLAVLVDRDAVILDVEERGLRVDYLEVHDRVYEGAHVVFREHLLLRDVDGLYPQVDDPHLLQE